MIEITALRLENKSCKGFLLQVKYPPMRALGFITGHVIFKLRYNHIYQLKTTMIVEYDALQNADKAPIAG